MSDLPYMARIVAVFVTFFGAGLMAIAVWQRKSIRPALLTFALGASMLAAFYTVYSSTVEATDSRSGIGTRRAVKTSGDSSGLLQRVIDAIGRNVSVVITARAGFDRANREGQVGTALPESPLDTAPDLLWNLPRAMSVAAFAPFPSTLLNGVPGVSNLRQFLILE